MAKNSFESIVFSAEKVYVHHWPLNTPEWSQSIKDAIKIDLNQNPDKKKIVIQTPNVRINDYNFDSIQKIGLTIPLFKKETTMVFEGKFKEFAAHVHITTHSQEYLEIFNKLMAWKNKFFPET